MSVTFTILLPVHRPPALLPYAIESVLAQERADFELFIVCDGAPEATVECASAVSQRDRRIRVRAHPKGERHGELYRHQALEEAKGIYVCEIADDDLWFPNHLNEIDKLLQEVEFGNLLEIHVNLDGSLNVLLGDLARPQIRCKMSTNRFNFFGPTVAGYRMSTYRRLPVGWAPGPIDIWSDLFMWRKFLALQDIVCGTRIAFTNLHFPTTRRRDWSLEKRSEEMKSWADRIKEPRARDRLSQQFLHQFMMAEILRRRDEKLRKDK